MQSIIAIDQSLRETGICINGGIFHLLKYTTHKYNSYQALFNLKKDFSEFLDICTFTHAVLEGFSYHSVNKSFTLGGVQAIIIVCLIEKNIPFLIVTPQQLKMFIVGKDSATKEEVMEKVNNIYSLKLKNDNLSDALALYHICRYKLEEKFETRKQLEILNKLDFNYS